jgi:hypothetical protein
MRKSGLLPVILLVLVSGCTTIHFDNGDTSNPSTVKTQWHHNVVLALYEVSDPVNLKEECGSEQWTSVKTELSFINGLASSAVNFFIPIWYPKTVEVSCN